MRAARRLIPMDERANRIPSTSYVGEAAYTYDARRFTKKQAVLFSDLEFRQLKWAVRGLDRASHILEVGCGTARFSQYLAERGFSVVATDPSPDMIRIASSKCSHLDTITFQREEGASLSFADSTFDFVFAIRVLNQTESAEYAFKMIREMIRVTKSGGLVLLEFVNKERPFPKEAPTVRLSFDQIEQHADACNCGVLDRRGLLVFSQSLLNRIPTRLVPLWGMVERAAGRVFWRWASRGYIHLRKR
jgi:SAM-dependent methyltransferase